MPNVTHVTTRNGITLVLWSSVVNTGLQMLTSFGIQMSDAQRAGITAFVNAVVILFAYVSHLPEKTADGGKIQVSHVPVLVTTPSPEPPAPVIAAPPPAEPTATVPPPAG